MERITYAEMDAKFRAYNADHLNGEDGTYITAVVVFKASNWEKPYTEEQRSYRVVSNCRAFQSGKISNAVYGDCLDGKDLGVRLDWYRWDVDYCYMD